MSAKLRSAALRYAEKGWPVFPCRPRGKEPLTEHGFKDATTDPAVIQEMWSRCPDANIATSTGPAGLVVFDVDGPNGEQSLAALIRQHGELPLTLEQKTGRADGGRQLFFLADGADIRNDTGRKLGPGLDVRACGGYVLLPPSIHPDTGAVYKWVRKGPPLPLPDWLRKKLVTPIAPLPRGDSPGTIPQGQRNSALASLAGSMRRGGLTQEAIEAHYSWKTVDATRLFLRRRFAGLLKASRNTLQARQHPVRHPWLRSVSRSSWRTSFRRARPSSRRG